MSRSRESALPLASVKLLTLFLKNLSFTMYFYETELTGEIQSASPAGLGTYFGTGSLGKNYDYQTNQEPHENTDKRNSEQKSFLGIAGMTFTYVRDIVTRVIRMLYDRDSRRRFLPRDHWLMTSHFDMKGFIPA